MWIVILRFLLKISGGVLNMMSTDQQGEIAANHEMDYVVEEKEDVLVTKVVRFILIESKCTINMSHDYHLNV